MYNRQQALDLLHKHMQNQNLRRHCYAVEAVMKALAKYFKEDEESWAIAGLLHDADYELTKNDSSKHVVTVVSWLKAEGVDEKIINAIYAHGWNYVPDCPQPKKNMEWSLYCCDELTGLIVAVALVRPDPPPGEAGKKLSTVTVESVMKKWSNKSFAAGASRDQIALCEEKLGIKLPDFIDIALKAMQGISGELGL
ncbi:HDIG domain-containing protein [Candidatus Microgenomates bacterium]|nr:HDIG domain-containing protein [Candidatus Microgenomates bacterium]